MPQKLQTQPTQQIDSKSVREKLLSDERLFKLVVIYDRQTWGSENSENQQIIAKYARELGIKDLNNVKGEIEKEIRNLLKNDNLNDKQIEKLNKLLTDNWQTRKLFISEKYLEYAKYQIENRLAFKDKDFDFNIRQILSLLPEEIKNKKKIINGQRVGEALEDLTIHGLEHILNTSDRWYSLYKARIFDTDIGKFNETSRTIQNAIDPQLNDAFTKALKTDETTGVPGTTREPDAKRQGPTPQRTEEPQKTQKPQNPFLTDKWTAKEIVEYAILYGDGKVKGESKNVSTTREMIYKYFMQEEDTEKKENMKEALILIFDFLGGPKAYAFIAKIAREKGEGKTAGDVLVDAVSEFKNQYGKSLNKEQKESLEKVLKTRGRTDQTPPTETTKSEGGTDQTQTTGTTTTTSTTTTTTTSTGTITTTPTPQNNKEGGTQGTTTTTNTNQTQTDIQQLQKDFLKKLIMALDTNAKEDALNTLDLKTLKEEVYQRVEKFINNKSGLENGEKTILKPFGDAIQKDTENEMKVDKMRNIITSLLILDGAMVAYGGEAGLPNGFKPLVNNYAISKDLESLFLEESELNKHLLNTLKLNQKGIGIYGVENLLKEIITGKKVEAAQEEGQFGTITDQELTAEQKWLDLNIAAEIFRIWNEAKRKQRGGQGSTDTGQVKRWS